MCAELLCCVYRSTSAKGESLKYGDECMGFDFEKYDQNQRVARLKRIEYLASGLTILSEAVIYQESLLKDEANDLMNKIKVINTKLNLEIDASADSDE